jgi:hypothetical protein
MHNTFVVGQISSRSITVQMCYQHGHSLPLCNVGMAAASIYVALH